MLLPLLLLVNILLVESSSILPTAAEVTSRKVNNDTKGRLVFAHVIFRHGDRTPTRMYPTDPWNNVTHWPTGWGQLTSIGKQQHFALGQWLRQRYDSLHSPDYSNDEIYISSTNYPRTRMSALSNLAGLYAPKGTDWNPDIALPKIPLHISSDSVKCPVHSYDVSRIWKMPEFNKNSERYAYLYKYLTEHVGYKVKTVTHIRHISDTLYIESLYNKTLPEWTKKVYPSADMTYLSILSFLPPTYTRKMARLRSGPFIKEMLQRFDRKAKGKLSPDRNLWIYSSHDTTMVNILNTLKVYEMHIPGYAACIMFELRMDEGQQPFVSLHYKNGPGAKAKTLEIPKCGKSCPLSKMFSLYEDILPIDWKKECERKKGTNKSEA